MKKQKLKTIRVEGDFKDYFDLSKHLVDSHYQTLLEEYVSKIQDAWQENLDTVHIINIVINDHQKITLANPRQNWITSLNEALRYFERKEDFKKCIEINALIEKISVGETVSI